MSMDAVQSIIAAYDAAEARRKAIIERAMDEIQKANIRGL